MSARDAFIDWLSRCVADGFIAEGDAVILLGRFDAGALDATWLAGLPAAPKQTVSGADDAAIAAALLLLLNRLRPQAPASASAMAATGRLPLAPAAGGFRGVRVVTALQRSFKSQAGLLAADLSSGRMDVNQWQAAMRLLLEESLTQASLLGGGRTVPTVAQQARLDAELRRQSAYLSRFADEAFLRAGFGAPMSEAYVANRAGLYGGAPRALFFTEAAAENAETAGTGWVVQYLHRDDGGVCPACLGNAGYYLPTSAYPVPASNCYGGASCRCRLEMHYDPARYARLMRGEWKVR